MMGRMRSVVIAAIAVAPLLGGAIGYCVDVGLYVTAGGLALGTLPLVVMVAEYLSTEEDG